MHKSSELVFASSNLHKYGEVQNILGSFGITLRFFESKLEEIQSGSIEEIAQRKARDAFSRCGKPVIVEDDGLFIDSLGGFPGPYSSYVFQTIGNRGILDLLKGDKSRRAHFTSVISYCDAGTLQGFGATLDGTISVCAQGEGWGYDPIFRPAGRRDAQHTFAELTDGRKNEISHRHCALESFSRWYLHKMQ